MRMLKEPYTIDGETLFLNGLTQVLVGMEGMMEKSLRKELTIT